MKIKVIYFVMIIISFLITMNMYAQSQTKEALNTGEARSVTIIETYENPNFFSLSHYYLNPLNSFTEISYSIPKAAGVKISIYNMLAREIAVVVYEYQQAGTYKVKFDASQLTSGVYFYKMIAGDFVRVKKMTLVR